MDPLTRVVLGWRISGRAGTLRLTAGLHEAPRTEGWMEHGYLVRRSVVGLRLIVSSLLCAAMPCCPKRAAPRSSDAMLRSGLMWSAGASRPSRRALSS